MFVLTDNLFVFEGKNAIIQTCFLKLVYVLAR